MTKNLLLGATALRSFAGITAAIAMAVPAVAAQQAPADSTTPAAAADTTTAATTPAVKTAAADDAIVVTGSRIRRPNLTSQLPVTSVSGKEFFETGKVSIGDTLAELPSIRSTFTQANSTRFLGTAGLNLLDLRGLGTVRTLVLVNGRRHVGGDVLSSGVTPDVNTIPTDLVERVDVVTGGSSAVYGSDAIAGVVNFILKDHFQGFQVRGQGGVSTYNDADAQFVSVLAGQNFAEGRGNIAINAEYAHQKQYFADARPNLRTQNAFVGVDTDPAGTPNGSDGIPDAVFTRDVRNAGLTNTGVIRFGGNAALNCGTGGNGVVFNCPFTFNPDGTLVPLTGQRIGLGPNGSFVGGNGENFRTGNQFQLSPNLDRYNINLIGHFEVSPAFVPFIEAKFSRTDTSGTGSSGPAFITGTALGDPAQFAGYYNRETTSINNPFLTPQARATIVQQRTLAGLTTTANTRFSLRENLTGLGARTEEARRDTYRVVVGVKGDFNSDWHYELSANYGRLKEATKINGNLNIQRFLLANDAVRDPVSGNIVCRSKIDPTGAIAYVDDGTAASQTILNQDVAACVPINPLGGQFTQAQRDYLLANTVAIGKTKQVDFNGFVAGDLSQLFSLPGGPISFVVGAEYREDNVSYQQDPLVNQGYTFYNAIPTFTAPKSKVKEAYAELNIPLLKDLPFIHELTLSGAGRISHYSIGTTGTVKAYNGGVEWAPIKDLRLRGNYSRSVRAPNQVELFSPLGQNFAPGFSDPCAARNIGAGSTTRAANCAAAGIPTSYDFVYSQSLETRSGGNALLAAEKSDSITLGGVLTPRFIPGLSISADYYNIRVKKVITSPGAQAIVNSCYDAASLSNPFCALFRRAGSTIAPTGEDPFQILEASLIDAPVNYAKLIARGIDFELDYNHTFPGIGRFETRVDYTHVFQRSAFVNTADPKREDRILSELGDPQDAFNWQSSLQHGKLTVGYKMRYIGKMLTGNYEDFFSLQGRPPENADVNDIKYFPSRFYHDVRLGLDFTKKINVYIGADNVTNTKPPLSTTGITGGSAIYDNRGRYFYAGFVAKY